MNFSNDFNLSSLTNYFYRLVEKSQDIFWIRDGYSKSVLYVSPAFEKIFDMVDAELSEGVSSFWKSVVHPEDKADYDKNLNMVCSLPQDQISRMHEYRIIRKDGAMRYLQETMFCLYDQGGQFFGYAGITKDMTAEKESMADIEKAMHYFRFFAEKLNAVFWARNDSYDRQIYLSPAYEKIWGRSRDELYCDPDSWLKTVHPDDRAYVTDTARFRILEECGLDACYEKRYRIILPDGSIKWIKDTSFPIQNEKKGFIGFAGIAEDITKEALYEKDLRDAKERAEVANKAKSDFLAMISHEIRTPLNAVMGMAEIMKQKGLSDEMQEYVDIISSAGNDLLSLVGDILDFARLEAGKLTFNLEPFDLGDLFRQILQTLKYQLREKDVRLMLEIAPDLQTAVIGDHHRVRQVLANLVGNAVKFTEQGHIKVILRGSHEHDVCLYEVIVEDTGIGIPEDKLNSIFEKFSQVDSIYQRKAGGIGLGLAITKELVEKMGGTVSVTSQFGSGTVFKVTLPLSLQHSVMTSAANTHSDMPARFDKNILVVEDNLINQKIARMMLEDLGCRVDIVSNGADVLDKVDRLPDYDLIFMDVGLPDMSGYDIAAEIRQRHALKSLPIIAMTAHVLDRDRRQAYHSGMNNIVAKPVTYDQIRTVLEQYR